MKESDDTDDTIGPDNVSPRTARSQRRSLFRGPFWGRGKCPMLGSPTGHTSVLQLPDKSVGRALAERTVGSGVGEARGLAKHQPTGWPCFEHRGE
jgi:hypothetical protein